MPSLLALLFSNEPAPRDVNWTNLPNTFAGHSGMTLLGAQVFLSMIVCIIVLGVLAALTKNILAVIVVAIPLLSWLIVIGWLPPGVMVVILLLIAVAVGYGWTTILTGRGGGGSQ